MKKNYILKTSLFLGSIVLGLTGFAQNGDLSPCYASSYHEYTPGLQNNGDVMPASRMNPEEALGIPENDGGDNFVSLGYGGSLVLGFSEVALNGAGVDIQVYETTFAASATCDSYTELSEVWASQNGVEYLLLGTTCTNEIGEFDISDANPDWDYISYVKIIDISPENSSSLDGYDVDGVVALHGCDLLENVITTPEGCAASEVLSYIQGPNAMGGMIDAIRTNPMEATGVPENDNTYNFVSLGYGGSLTVGFSEVALNGEGNDIQVFETTFNEQDCGSYEETAEVWISQNGVDYILLGTTCTNQDDAFDISDVAPEWTYVAFVRVVDITSEGSVSFDAFDVDAILALNGCDLLANIVPAHEGCPASEVLTYIQGTSSTGGAIPVSRTDAEKALGMPQDDNTENFVTLGYGGTLIVGFNQVAVNGEGNDIQVFETSFGSTDCDNYEEVAEVYISQDGINYTLLGTTCTNQDDAFDISDVEPAWQYVSFVKLVDVTSEGSVSTDGFDVDAILALNGCDLLENYEIIPGGCVASEVISYTAGTSSNGGAIAADRTNPELALGIPEDDDATLNFVTLGYGGSLILGFDGPVINGEGDDMYIVETSYSGPACTSGNGYEVADVYVSQDNVTYHFLGTICRDAGVDISDSGVELPYILYLKIVNNNVESSTPDGYDVDGVYVLNNDCGDIEIGGNGIPPVQHQLDLPELSSYPNPAVNETVVNFIIPSTEYVTLDVYNTSGQKVMELFNQVASENQDYKIDFNTTNLPNGIYIYRLTTSSQTTIEKFVIAR